MEPPSFRWDSDAPEHLYCETLDPLEKTLAFPSTPLYGRRKGVAQWNFLFAKLKTILAQNYSLRIYINYAEIQLIGVFTEIALTSVFFSSCC